ncbi:MAG TPA: aminotransferase class I/II-fold pyridoxal phosphate-dependent enzyme [Candidatus Limivivens merdigallinarum]|uniref:cysteine-S-conjugate beta-lyase n=1 Tax=Candidatus Limivivens merdigallinarum TaxID=2840859 RepID=A0A9D1D1T3_9FIRM|nr:aminotransferase class I/II-fold pyridoxal phosphate-dependent enzyme [Candidatus Limivivens merdigallinarum]
MKYDFTTIMDRSGRDSIAVDVPFEIPEAKEGFDRIPMWVADMNFPTVPTVQKVMTERIQHPAFGYFRPREEYYQAIIRWQERRHKVSGLKTEHIGYENGVLGGVVSALNVFCSKGDKVLLHSPTYIGFTNALTNNGYEIVLSPLKRDEEGIWRMDFEDMERKLQEHHIHAAIFCSPHNPSGRVWERWEIERAMEIYERNRVYVISDEIWSDLILGEYEHIPTQSVSEDAKMRTVALYAPSKTFNLAGLVGSYHIIYDPWIRERVEKESSLCHYNEMNVLSMYALIGAYQEEGYEWVEELCQVLTGNVEFAYGYIKDHFPGVSLMKPQGTYMLFLDCGEWLREHKMTLQELLDRGMEYGVIWQDGRPFHGETSIRMNLALPRSRVEEAFERLNRYVFRKL